ncbi:MAG: hypothetical protein AB7S70_09170 [Hyphomicrobium sp.]|uniref:hypothetical protein n=1 Tax=Hyphomicrobium sp. TaxID=82 RepID=UPI003D0D6214
MAYARKIVVASALALGLTAAVATAASAAKLREWTVIGSESRGFTIAYPASVFVPRGDAQSEDGHVLVSRDGGARLVVGAFDNEDAATLGEYREQLLSDNYSGADLDYAPMKRRYFVISGTQGSMHFYERVSFTCGGRLINSWALLYPVSERHIYDPIVEAIARTYSPGAGRTGHCD